jgi:flagella basal body P-ring formation protein FlgA
MTSVAALAAAACLAVGADRDEILVRDIAAAFSAAGSLPLESVVALAPAPGIQRRFELAELRRIALRLKLPEPERETCVERRAAPLQPSRIVEAMRAQWPEARIELVDYSRYPVPDGDLEFPRSGLRVASPAAMWSGFVRYGGRHRAAVWARVKVSMSSPRIIAAVDLRPGQPIDASSLRIEVRDELPIAEPFAGAIEDVAGRIPRRPIRAGTAIRAGWLDAPKAVGRGETVQVEAREGGAVLRFEGQAQGSGAVGQTIPVLNTMSKKRFSARVEGKGKVSLGGGSR